MADSLLIAWGSPSPVAALGSAPSFATTALDAANDALEFIVQAREAVTISRVGFLYGQTAGTPPTYRVSLQGVAADGTPDGTVLGGDKPASATFTPPPNASWDGAWKWIELANPYAVAGGDLFAIVIDHSAGAVDASNRGSIRGGVLLLTHSAAGFPYYNVVNSGSRTRQIAPPVFGYGSAAKAYGCPLQSTALTEYDNLSEPDEMALAFRWPESTTGTYQVAGFRARVKTPAAGKSVVVSLYQGGAGEQPKLLQRMTWNSDVVRASAASDCLLEGIFNEATLATLRPGFEYRLAFAPAGGTPGSRANFALRTLTCAAPGDWAAWSGGTNCWLSTRTDGGIWDDDKASRPLVELLVTDMTAASGRWKRRTTWNWSW